MRKWFVPGMAYTVGAQLKNISGNSRRYIPLYFVLLFIFMSVSSLVKHTAFIKRWTYGEHHKDGIFIADITIDVTSVITSRIDTEKGIVGLPWRFQVYLVLVDIWSIM